MVTEGIKLPQVFLCHASEDKEKVREIYDHLKKEGFNPWLDKINLLPGQRWDKEITKAIENSDFVLVFFSKASVSKRGYVQKEFKLTCDILDQIPDEHIFVIPIRLDECEVPHRFRSLQWSDVFEEGDFEKVMKTLHQETKRMDLIKPMRLRSEPLEKLSDETILKMLREKDFFDNYRNKKGKSLPHKYELIISDQKFLVVDLAIGLTFQQSGSNKRMTFDEANDYISDLKTQKFGGYEDWRLPTLEEAMSLAKPRKQGALYIHSIFEQKQVSIWTADKKTSSLPWVVNFSSGTCYYGFGDAGSVDNNYYVRAVRSGSAN